MRITEIESSGHVVLGCHRCGERLVLLGPEEDWRSEESAVFRCGGCGEKLTLTDRLGENEGTTNEEP